jgi:hypothetical protein
MIFIPLESAPVMKKSSFTEEGMVFAIKQHKLGMRAEEITPQMLGCRVNVS